MRDPSQKAGGNQSLSITDYQWGEASDGLKIGRWASSSSIQIGGRVDVRVAARNLSSSQITLGNRFELVVQNSEKIDVDAGEPRSGSPIRLKAGEFQEILSWRLEEQINQRAGAFQCWAIYHPRTDKEIRSAVVSIEITSPLT